MGKAYQVPAVTEHGSVEAITQSSEKCSPGHDDFEDTTGLQGSIQECEPG
ncbi:lasso RiPP family leader peptide-containing protein [Halorientalis persicus]